MLVLATARVHDGVRHAAALAALDEVGLGLI